ncbi:MAG: hypothetical protein JNK38_10620, partial [Acidobacteria bacterium]|nr:hypothetical protein [Acidobacteriota bacterium]
AHSSGLDTQEFVQRYLEVQFSGEPVASQFSPREAELLQQIELDLPEARWRRYRKLSKKLLAEQRSAAGEKFLAAGEYEELLELTQQVEAANVKRIERLSELARLRKISLPELKKQLGIKTPEPE